MTTIRQDCEVHGCGEGFEVMLNAFRRAGRASGTLPYNWLRLYCVGLSREKRRTNMEWLVGGASETVRKYSLDARLSLTVLQRRSPLYKGKSWQKGPHLSMSYVTY